MEGVVAASSISSLGCLTQTYLFLWILSATNCFFVHAMKGQDVGQKRVALPLGGAWEQSLTLPCSVLM